MTNVEVSGHARGANRAQTSTATGGRGDESHVRIAVADEDRHRPRDQPAVTKPLPPTARMRSSEIIVASAMGLGVSN
jgi:hypothetical protein